MLTAASVDAVLQGLDVPELQQLVKETVRVLARRLPADPVDADGDPSSTELRRPSHAGYL